MFIIADADMKQFQNIKQVSYRHTLRQDIEEKLLIKQKNFQILETLSRPWYSSNEKDSTRKHRLGVVHKATMNKKNVLCRVINFDRITSYILEDYF